ncbi:guanine nucleotide binding protein, alpha subunit [Imleria badia]|nr:guanine nucleotide binding protein, alpha subunit [Imleria badia]
MGARVSTWYEAKARSAAIDRQIKEEARSCRKVNMLLLGTDPEKSKIMKRMKVHHGLTNDERMRHRLTIYQNSLDSAQALVRAIRDMGIEYADPMNHANADHILDYRIQHISSFMFSPEIAEAIHQLLQDPILPKVMNRRSEFRLPEHAEYFFEEIRRIGSPDYLPTDDDILQAQENLSQVIETHFTRGTLRVSIIDVRNLHSPAKWKRHFYDVTSYIIFCVSLSCYDQALQEDDCQNLLSESFTLFDCVVNSRWFTHTSVILFLTNVDAFERKLRKVPLKRYFPSYTGGDNVEEAMRYILWNFFQTNRARLPIRIIDDRATTRNITANMILITVENDILRDMKLQKT